MAKMIKINKEKDLKISELKIKSKDNDKGSRSKITQHEGTSLQQYKDQLADYGVLYENVPIFCENTSVIAISNNLVLHSRRKHIDIRYHFIRDHILKGDIELHFVPTDMQLVDIFTKPLAEPSFTRLVTELGGMQGAHDQLNINQQPDETLILSSERVNVDDTADKSLCGTSIQHHAEEPAATADITKSVDAFESVEELGNQPKQADAEKDQQHPVHESQTSEYLNFTQPHRDPIAGNATFGELFRTTNEIPYDTESEIKFVGKEKVVPESHDDAIEITLIGSSRDAKL
ncbi:hypothetical protein Tco_1517565 [Tanacetum coccineum]